jgi:hypothetical protein
VLVAGVSCGRMRVSGIVHTMNVAWIIDWMQMPRVIHTVSVSSVSGRMTVFS